MQNTLFDEGMRIAQQFGLSDFAEELKGLVDTSPEEETKAITDPVVKRKAYSLHDSENGESPSKRKTKRSRAEVNGTDGDKDEDSWLVPSIPSVPICIYLSLFWVSFCSHTFGKGLLILLFIGRFITNMTSSHSTYMSITLSEHSVHMHSSHRDLVFS